MKRFAVILLAVLAVPGLAFAAAKADKVPTVGGNRSYYNIYDEDTMSSDSATGLPTQQSVKAFVKDATVINFPLSAAVVDGTGPITSATAPNLTTLDNVGAILYDDSGEVTPVQWGFVVPSASFTTVTFYAMVSSDESSGTGTKLDWALIKNDDDTGFASVTAQDVVECTSAALAVSNEVLTLTPDATGAALFTAGAKMTLEIFNASTNDDDLEIKHVWAIYQ